MVGLMALFVFIAICCLMVPTGVVATAGLANHASRSLSGDAVPQDVPAQLAARFQSILGRDRSTMERMLTQDRPMAWEGLTAEALNPVEARPPQAEASVHDVFATTRSSFLSGAILATDKSSFLAKATSQVEPSDSACNPPCIVGQGVCASSRSGAAPRCHCREPFHGAQCAARESAPDPEIAPQRKSSVQLLLEMFGTADHLPALLDVPGETRGWLATSVSLGLLVCLAIALLLVGPAFVMMVGMGCSAKLRSEGCAGCGASGALEAPSLGCLVWRSNVRALAGVMKLGLAGSTQRRAVAEASSQRTSFLVGAAKEESAPSEHVMEVWGRRPGN